MGKHDYMIQINFRDIVNRHALGCFHAFLERRMTLVDY